MTADAQLGGLTEDEREELRGLLAKWSTSAGRVGAMLGRDIAPAVERIVAAREAAARAEALREALAGIRTHNGQPLSPTNLRWAATHEALCRSFIFDVLTGLADALSERDAEGGEGRG